MDRRESHRKKFYDVIPSDSRFLFNPRKLQRYIKRVITAQEVGRKKSPGDYALLNRYDVARIGGGRDILIKKNSIDPFIRYISEDEVFDAIYDAHIKVGHGGQKKTHYELKKNIANVTREQVALFLSYCVTCEEKRSIKKNKRVVRPITSSSYGERGQVDLIDMRACRTTDNYCFILHYQDHFTKFSVLKALHSKQTSEVSQNLYDIFTLIGAPKLLQSDNGNEFVGASLTTMMQKFWPETKLIRGSPRHPQSQGSVERANGHVKKILWGLLREKSTCTWVDLLKQVQWIKNNVNHRVIGMSPYEAMFGQNHTTPMKIVEQMETEEEDGDGVQQQQQQQQQRQQEEQPWDEQMRPMNENGDGIQLQHQRQQQQQQPPCADETGIPDKNEEEGQQQRQQQEEQQPRGKQMRSMNENGDGVQSQHQRQQQQQQPPCADETGIPDKDEEEGQRQQEEQQPRNKQMGIMDKDEGVVQQQRHQQQEQQPREWDKQVEISGEEESVEDEEMHVSATEDEQHLEEIIKIRQRVKDGIEQQASKMIKNNSSSSLHPEINDCVNVTVPRVERPRKMSLRNIIGVIVAIEERKAHKLYSVATKHGCIRPLLSRNQFEICRQKNLIDIEMVNRERTVSIREIAASEAIKGSGGPSSNICYCATDYCRTMRCLCRRKDLLCTERCKHGRNPKTGRINQEIAVNFKCFNK